MNNFWSHFGPFLLVVIVLGVAILVLLAEWQMARKKLAEEVTKNESYSKNLYENKEFWQTFVDQEQVDKVLTRLALSLWLACQNALSPEKKYWVENIASRFASAMSEISALKENAERWSEEYHKASLSARNRGFTVRDSWNKYLPNDTSPS